MQDDIQPGRGFLLALLTASLWGILPVFLTLCLQAMDSPTITVYRFASAGVIVLYLLHKKAAIPRLSALGSRFLWLTTAATALLVVNYVTNVIGLKYLSPASVQILMQIAPFALMVGGIVFYREHFSRLQLAGALSLLTGLSLFFHHRLPQIAVSEQEDVIGIVFIVVAALSWAGYALSQKVLLKRVSARQLTALIYVVGTCMLLPFSTLSQITQMNGLQIASLAFCCANTLIAYGAFTEALRVWYASRVSAVLASAPLFTFLAMLIAEKVWPQWFTQPELDVAALTGAALVMLGSVCTALGRDTALQSVVANRQPR